MFRCPAKLLPSAPAGPTGLGCTGLGWVHLNQYHIFSQKPSANRISSKGSDDSFPFSTQTDKRNLRVTRKGSKALFHDRPPLYSEEPEMRDGVGVTTVRMPITASC